MSASTVFAMYCNHNTAIEVEIHFILWIKKKNGRETKTVKESYTALAPSDLLCHSRPVWPWVRN